MSGSLKLGIIIILAVLFGGIVIRIITGVLSTIWGLVVPLALVAGIGLVIYGLIDRKAIGGGRRRYLP